MMDPQRTVLYRPKPSDLEWLEGPVTSTVLLFLPFPSPFSLQKHKTVLKRGDRQRAERIWPPGPRQCSKQSLNTRPPEAPIFTTARLEGKCTANMQIHRENHSAGRSSAAREQKQVKMTSL